MSDVSYNFLFFLLHLTPCKMYYFNITAKKKDVCDAMQNMVLEIIHIFHPESWRKSIKRDAMLSKRLPSSRYENAETINHLLR